MTAESRWLLEEFRRNFVPTANTRNEPVGIRTEFDGEWNAGRRIPERVKPVPSTMDVAE
jgi:hypothetical protein